MNTAEEDERSYYIDDYTDEVLPCLPTLEAWAQWLSKPSEDWNREEPAVDGVVFDCSVIRWGRDIVVTFDDGKPVLSYEPEGASLLAVRFGEGMGWDCEDIVDSVEGLIEFLDANPCDATEYVAVGYDEPSVRLIYRADPPRLEIGGPVQ